MQDRIKDETELIQTYFAPLSAPGGFGLSDDAALLSVEAGHDIVVSTDPIRAGVHFFVDDDPRDIAWKALAVNVSDLIAKGATPIGYTMALAFADAPLKTWMAEFSNGLREAQVAFGCQLLGGDCDRADAALSIAITAFGQVPRGRFIQRNTARVGDHVFVTGSIGDSALGLTLRRDNQAFGSGLSSDHVSALIQAYLRPRPDLRAIDIVRRFATAALDVSDGLIQDAARLARGAQAALAIPASAVPLSPAAEQVLQIVPNELKKIVTGGDDFEVLFAVAPEDRHALATAADKCGLQVHMLGTLTQGSGVTLLDSTGQVIPLDSIGFDHFREVHAQ